jgi:hypothetical protein
MVVDPMSTPSGFDAVTREKFDALAAEVEREWARLLAAGGDKMLAEIDAAVSAVDESEKRKEE